MLRYTGMRIGAGSEEFRFPETLRLASVAPETFAGSEVCGATTMSYLYDPDGRRVAKIQSGAVVKQIATVSDFSDRGYLIGFILTRCRTSIASE
jgi:hypothetical protein